MRGDGITPFARTRGRKRKTDRAENTAIVRETTRITERREGNRGHREKKKERSDMRGGIRTRRANDKKTATWSLAAGHTGREE